MFLRKGGRTREMGSRTAPFFVGAPFNKLEIRDCKKNVWCIFGQGIFRVVIRRGACEEISVGVGLGQR